MPSKKSSNITSELAAAKARISDFAAVRQVPIDPQERNALRERYDRDLYVMFTGTLSARERDLVRRTNVTDSEDSEDVRRILAKLDKFILYEARTIGWPILLSDDIVARLTNWYYTEQNGPELLEELGKALALGARITRGSAKAPMVDRELYEAKEPIKRELRRLLNRIRDVCSVSGKTLDMTQIRSLVREEIESKSNSFLLLWQNRHSLSGFLQYLEDTDLSAAGRLANGEIKAAGFFHEWGAWSMNREPESFRQKLSELGSQKINP